MTEQNPPFVPQHLSATAAHFEGNGGLGRYVFLPGSPGRARQIGEGFQNLEVVRHARGHDVHLGTIDGVAGPIDVASVSTGMGAPSLEIIVTELFHLGVRRFLRVGTSGSLQPDLVGRDDFVIASAAVRDEGASGTYAPPGFPAVASPAMVMAAQIAAAKLGFAHHVGVVHSKDTFYAREFGHGPLAQEHAQYRGMLTAMHTLVSEMEASMLFILRAHFEHTARQQPPPPGADPRLDRVLAGGLFMVIGEPEEYSDMAAQLAANTARLVTLGFETVRQLAAIERSA